MGTTLRGINIGMNKRGRLWHRWATEAGLEIVGVVDLLPELLEQAQRELGVAPQACFTSIREAAKALSPDCCVIVTANAAHKVCINDALDGGLHVLCEKPLVESPVDAHGLIAKAREVRRTLAVVQNYRYTPMMLTMRQAVQGGLVGEIVSLLCRFSRWRPSRGMTLPLLLNQGIHHFDSVRWVLGQEPLDVMARCWNPQWNDCDGPTKLEAVWRFERGCTFTYSGSYVNQGEQTGFGGQWWIEGSKGTLEASDAGVVLTTRELGEGKTVERRRELEMIAPPLPPLSEVCRQFLLAVEAGGEPPTAANDHIRSLAMCWSAWWSSREDRLVSQAETLDEARASEIDAILHTPPTATAFSSAR